MTNPDHPAKFKTSHLKVDRAKRHLDELSSEVDRYLSSAPVKLVWEQMPWTERYRATIAPESTVRGLVIHVLCSVPEPLAPIAGDVVHNLRSALDIMMCELVIDADQSVFSKSVNFPFWELPSKKDEAVRKSKARCAGQKVIDLINAWEPFQGGSSRLYALSQLDNMDKHRTLIPTMNGVEFSESYALVAHEIPADEFIDPFPARKLAVDRVPLISGAVESLPPIGTEVPCVCHLGLDGVDDIRGLGLLEELQWQLETVRAVLLSFELGIKPEFNPVETRKPVNAGSGIWIGPPEMSADEVFRYVVAQQDVVRSPYSQREEL